MFSKEAQRNIRHLTSSFSTVLGVVLVWRALWYTFDYIDIEIFGGYSPITVMGSFITGVLLLYLPDKNLEELRKL